MSAPLPKPDPSPTPPPRGEGLNPTAPLPGPRAAETAEAGEARHAAANGEGLGRGSSDRGAQVALVLFLAVLVGLLAFRGYGTVFGARPTEPAPADLIDLNTAEQSELAQVPGVGPKLAEAIVDHRRLHGAFKSVDELKTVRGVGPVTFEKIRNHFRVGELPKQPAVEAPASPNHPQTPARPAPAPRPASNSKKIQ